MTVISKLTAEQYLELEYVDNNYGFTFKCANCDAILSDIDLVSPCHPDESFLEPSGHREISDMHIYCVPNDPEVICNWGGPVAEFEPLTLCIDCKKSPFVV